MLALHRRDRFVACFHRLEVVPGMTQSCLKQLPDGLVRLDDENAASHAVQSMQDACKYMVYHVFR